MLDIEAQRRAVAKEARTLVCTADGVFIWPGIALVERRGSSFIRKADQEVINLALRSTGRRSLVARSFRLSIVLRVSWSAVRSRGPKPVSPN